jgi:hypothetical protein
MNLLGVLAQCSLAKDFALVLAMAMSHSGGDPYTVRSADVELASDDDADESTDVPGAARTREAALADIKRLRQPLIGLLPVPPEWAAIYQFRPEDLLDACINVSVATAQLSAYERRCAKRRDARSCALHAYAQEADALLLEFEVLDALGSDSPQRVAPVKIDTPDVLGADPLVTATPTRNEIGGMFVFTEPVQAPASEAPQVLKHPPNTKAASSRASGQATPNQEVKRR